MEIAEGEHGRAGGQDFPHLGGFHEHDAVTGSRDDRLAQLRLDQRQFSPRAIALGLSHGQLLLTATQLQALGFGLTHGRARSRHLRLCGLDLLPARPFLQQDQRLLRLLQLSARALVARPRLIVVRRRDFLPLIERVRALPIPSSALVLGVGRLHGGTRAFDLRRARSGEQLSQLRFGLLQRRPSLGDLRFDRLAQIRECRPQLRHLRFGSAQGGVRPLPLPFERLAIESRQHSSLLVLPLLITLTVWFKTNARRAYREVRTRIARINAFLQEHITGMAIVQLFNAERRSFERFDRLNAEHRQANLETIFYYAVFFPAVELVSALGIALIIWRGGHQVLEGEVTLGALIGFVQLSQRFFQPISDLSEKYNILQSAMAASERIFALLDTPVTIASRGGYRPERVRGEIEFRHVWFAYEGQEWVLRDVSFRVRPGETVALVGPTGSGKTTIAHLLLRFYDVQQGQILLDGVDIREWDLRALRRAVALVPQDVFLFSGDILTNIRLGETSISDERVREAARRVRAHEVIERLPRGYQTEVGERGARLSTGQKQLIAFARALCFDPPILILDEATAHIDPHTEGLIREALETLLVGRTSVIIAHRLATIQRADRIIVLHKGRVREIGTHAELLRRDGLYARLYRLQYRQIAGWPVAGDS